MRHCYSTIERGKFRTLNYSNGDFGLCNSYHIFVTGNRIEVASSTMFCPQVIKSMIIGAGNKPGSPLTFFKMRRKIDFKVF